MRILSPEDRAWLTVYVAPIILPAERDLFLQLSEDYQRESFKTDFWGRRERPSLPPPLGPGYEARYARLREAAAEFYDGVDSDAGRMVVRKGEPASIDALSGCDGVYRQAEIWSYRTDTSRSDTRHLFYRPSFGTARKLWIRGDREIFQTGSCLSTFEQSCEVASSGSALKTRDAFCPMGAIPKSCGSACMVAELATQINLRGLDEGSALLRAPAVSTEGLDGLWLRLATVSNSSAKPIAIEGPTRRPIPTNAELPDTSSEWTNERIRETILALPRKYREWLDLAGPILAREDLVTFLKLPAVERDAYVRRFWKKRAHVR